MKTLFYFSILLFSVLLNESCQDISNLDSNKIVIIENNIPNDTLKLSYVIGNSTDIYQLTDTLDLGQVIKPNSRSRVITLINNDQNNIDTIINLNFKPGSYFSSHPINQLPFILLPNEISNLNETEVIFKYDSINSGSYYDTLRIQSKYNSVSIVVKATVD